MNPEIDEVIRKAAIAQAKAFEVALLQVLCEAIELEATILFAHPDQPLDPVYVAGREVRRSPLVPLGTAYEVDPRLLDGLHIVPTWVMP